MAELRVLGPLEIVGDEGVAALGAAKQRRLLAALAIAGGRARTIDGLVEAVWGDAPPASAKKLLQVYVSQLRKALPDGLAVVTLADGYALTTNGAVVDATRFEEWGREAVEIIDDDPSLATTLADRALALWRGAPYGEFVDDHVVRLEAARLDELRLIFIETRFDALLRLGRHEQVCADAIASLREHPLRERLQAIVMLALYRSRPTVRITPVVRDASRALGGHPRARTERRPPRAPASDPEPGPDVADRGGCSSERPTPDRTERSRRSRS